MWTTGLGCLETVNDSTGLVFWEKYGKETWLQLGILDRCVHDTSTVGGRDSKVYSKAMSGSFAVASCLALDHRATLITAATAMV
jgi:hypothetical protein